MNKMIFLLLLLFSLPGFSKPLNIQTSCQSAILINALNGKILYEKNAYDKFFPASTTKVATALYVLETVSDIDQQVMVNDEALRKIESHVKHADYNCPAYILEPDGTTLGLYKNMKVNLKDLIYGILLCSGNDAANVLAQSVSGSIPLFIEELNHYLYSIGCKNTYFRNPHGLHFPEHYSTAYDLALITKVALKNDFFAKVVSSLSYQPYFRRENINQHNQLILPEKKFYYPKAIGVKTGYTEKAGYNLIAAAKDEHRTLIAVVLGCEKTKDRYEDAVKMFEKAFKEEKKKKCFFKQGQEFEKEIKGAKSSLIACLKEDLSVSMFPSEERELKMFIEWEPLVLPIQKGQKVGEIILRENSIQLTVLPLFAKNDIKTTFYYWITRLFSKK